MQIWKVTIKSDDHKHAVALAKKVEEIESALPHMRGSVLELDDARIVFELTVSSPDAVLTARAITLAMQEHVVDPTHKLHNTFNSHPAVKYLGDA